jgi:hypothetical protein
MVGHGKGSNNVTKRSVVTGALALTPLTGSAVTATATPTTGHPVELASQLTPLPDTPAPAARGGVLVEVGQFLQQLFAFPSAPAAQVAAATVTAAAAPAAPPGADGMGGVRFGSTCGRGAGTPARRSAGGSTG